MIPQRGPRWSATGHGILWQFGDAIGATILSMGICNNEIGFGPKEEETV